MPCFALNLQGTAKFKLWWWWWHTNNNSEEWYSERRSLVGGDDFDIHPICSRGTSWPRNRSIQEKLTNLGSHLMQKTAKENAHWNVNDKGGGVCKKYSQLKIHREQNPNPEELSFTQLKAKVVELSEFIKDEHNLHQGIDTWWESLRYFIINGGERKKN